MSKLSMASQEDYDARTLDESTCST